MATVSPRWLTADEQRAWRAFLQASQALFNELDRQLQRDRGISHADYEILVQLSEAEDGRMRMSELAERALFSRSRLSHAVARLEKDGLVAREDCDTDRRGTFAVLTARGGRALEQAAPGHVETVRSLLFDRLKPSDLAHLERIARAINEPPTPDRQAATRPGAASRRRAG
jgi:DNA-binding MarR family transcriptional regulator